MTDEACEACAFRWPKGPDEEWPVDDVAATCERLRKCKVKGETDYE
jgi:hypothetical protein